MRMRQISANALCEVERGPDDRLELGVRRARAHQRREQRAHVGERDVRAVREVVPGGDTRAAGPL
jgi:hypothetical protein